MASLRAGVDLIGSSLSQRWVRDVKMDLQKVGNS